jgi:copper binding plastocyanin/azurin family protein
MRRIALAVAACVAIGYVLVARGTPSSADGRKLHGTVGPGFTIRLSDEDGQPVTSLRPGEYWLTVDDLSNRHNFHVIGPGLDEIVTTVPFTGTVTVKIHLSHGTYTFQCDPHASMGMLGNFDVGGVGQGG